MSGFSEVKNRIKSVGETQKITNALYLISSAKVRKARSDLERTMPYFNAIRHEVKEVFKTIKRFDSVYFYPENDHMSDADYGYLVITGDKGMAGAYNNNVIKSVEKEISNHKNSTLYVIGDLGREYFKAHGYNVDEDFKYNAYRPTLAVARKITQRLLDDYRKDKIYKLFIVYTDVVGINAGVKSVRVLPFHSSEFVSEEEKGSAEYEFEPSAEKVLDSIVPSYVTGFVYSAMVDSFCAEQTSRLSAMKSADDNARTMIEELKSEYNHARQEAITTEIIEVASGARFRKK